MYERVMRRRIKVVAFFFFFCSWAPYWRQRLLRFPVERPPGTTVVEANIREHTPLRTNTKCDFHLHNKVKNLQAGILTSAATGAASRRLAGIFRRVLFIARENATSARDNRQGLGLNFGER